MDKTFTERDSAQVTSDNNTAHFLSQILKNKKKYLIYLFFTQYP